MKFFFIVIIIGDSGVGKTAFLSKYVKGVFPMAPTPTIAIEFATKIIQIKEGGYIKAQIWDSAGQERYKAIVAGHYRRAAGALIVYDVTKKASFEHVTNWLKNINEMAEKNCITYLIGNKRDLVENNENAREVTIEEAQKYAKENGLRFYEASALTNENVNNSFEDLLQEIYNERRKIKGKLNEPIDKNTKILYLNKPTQECEKKFENCC
jgi:Rab family protein